jgi:ABC-type sugar transport system permease subunit
MARLLLFIWSHPAEVIRFVDGRSRSEEFLKIIMILTMPVLFFNLFTSFVSQRKYINICFIYTLHVSTPLDHHQVLLLNQ